MSPGEITKAYARTVIDYTAIAAAAQRAGRGTEHRAAGSCAADAMTRREAGFASRATDRSVDMPRFSAVLSTRC